jgi:5-dehydro-4-deoxyglucarate dehydratase
VSLIKAGAKIIGRSAGDVRAPLTMPSEHEVRLLEEIIKNSASK